MRLEVGALTGDRTMRRRRAAILALILSFLISLSYARVSVASWYTGNRRDNSYGIKAWIYAPSSAPYLEKSGESNWVSTPSPNWVQAGWRYYKGWSAAKPYVEHCISGNYGLTEYGTQSWGTGVNYRVQYNGYSTWYAYINDSNKGGWGPLSAPQQVLGYSEVHESSSNGLDTRFSSVYYRDSSYNWHLFDQGNWREDSPYAVQKDSYYYYRNYRP